MSIIHTSYGSIMNNVDGGAEDIHTKIQVRMSVCLARRGVTHRHTDSADLSLTQTSVPYVLPAPV